jgi:hypothetical protein
MRDNQDPRKPGPQDLPPLRHTRESISRTDRSFHQWHKWFSKSSNFARGETQNGIGMLAPTEAHVVSREELYELVWSMPMVKVAEKFKVLGTYD